MIDKTIYARFYSSQFRGNRIFNLNDEWNRDNCFEPYSLLKQKFLAHNIQIDTQDLNIKKKKLFDLHLDVSSDESVSPRYLLMLENPYICKDNGTPANWERYRKIFTWNDDLVDGGRFVKISLPNSFVIPEVDGWGERSIFCCLIAANKTLDTDRVKNLYIERVKTIRWFEKNVPESFRLYGIDWNLPVMPGGTLGKVMRRICRVIFSFLNFAPFPSYYGEISQKKTALLHSRFSICYENVADMPGYITEKIFDSFFSGCVPIYWGASNVEKYIPVDCFVDRRHFLNNEDLYLFLKSMSEVDFMGYQQRIVNFLNSDKSKQFRADSFAETIVSTILSDLGKLNLYKR